MEALAPAAKLNDAAVAEAQQKADELTLADESLLHYEEALRQIGQIDGLEFTKRISDSAIAQIFQNIKDSKRYIGLPYVDKEGNRKRISDLEEFCEVKFGKSARRMLDLSHNLRALGPDLYEASERLGLRSIDYKALRALPDSDQALIKSAIEGGKGRDELIDLLQEMAVKHHQEKAALEGTVEEQAQTIAAKDAVIETKAAKVAELDAKLKRVRTLPADQAATEIRAELNGYAIEVEAALVNRLAPAIAALKAHLATMGQGEQADEYLEGVLSQIEAQIHAIRDDNGLIRADTEQWSDGDPAPAWAKADLPSAAN